MLALLVRLIRRPLRSMWLRHFAYLAFSIYGVSAGFAIGLALGLLQVPDAAARIWHWVKSDIAKDIFLSFLAAYAGTSGAQLISEWNSRRKEKLAEMQAANGAIALAFNVANAYLLVKKQILADMCKNYEATRRRYILFSVGEICNPSAPPPVFNYVAELNTVEPPFSPIQHLEKVLVERISLDSRILFVLTALSQGIDGFARTCAARNEWIDAYRNTVTDEKTKLDLYLGMRQHSGARDDRYRQFLAALNQQTDDCIGFSQLIVERLRVDLKKAKEEFSNEFGPGAPKIANPTFHEAVQVLLPKSSIYDEHKKAIFPELTS